MHKYLIRSLVIDFFIKNKILNKKDFFSFFYSLEIEALYSTFFKNNPFGFKITIES